jgi:hypothetical protein
VLPRLRDQFLAVVNWRVVYQADRLFRRHASPPVAIVTRNL